MNKKAQDILEKHLKKSDRIGLNKCVINAMEEFAKYYHKKQLTLTDVGCSVWLIQEKNTLINYGLFNSKEKAEKYINGNENFAICEVFIK